MSPSRLIQHLSEIGWGTRFDCWWKYSGKTLLRQSGGALLRTCGGTLLRTSGGAFLRTSGGALLRTRRRLDKGRMVHFRGGIPLTLANLCFI